MAYTDIHSHSTLRLSSRRVSQKPLTMKHYIVNDNASQHTRLALHQPNLEHLEKLCQAYGVTDYSYNEIRIEGIEDYADDTLYSLLGHEFTVVGPSNAIWPFWIPLYGFFIGMTREVHFKRLPVHKQASYLLSSLWQSVIVLGGIIWLGMYFLYV